MERDPKTGRFLPGNRAAVGNKGNTKPKWGNKNALKHGLFTSTVVPKVKEDGYLYLSKYKYGAGIEDVIRIAPEGFIKDEDGIRLRDDLWEELEKRGFHF